MFDSELAEGRRVHVLTLIRHEHALCPFLVRNLGTKCARSGDLSLSTEEYGKVLIFLKAYVRKGRLRALCSTSFYIGDCLISYQNYLNPERWITNVKRCLNVLYCVFFSMQRGISTGQNKTTQRTKQLRKIIAANIYYSQQFEIVPTPKIGTISFRKYIFRIYILTHLQRFSVHTKHFLYIN